MGGARGPSRVRAILLVVLLALLALETPLPWGALWLAVPATVAIAMLAAWRFGAWSLVLPGFLLGAAITFAGPVSLWAGWLPMAALCGTWMGLREEGEGPASGERAWMLLPLLLLAASLPWAPHYAQSIAHLQREFSAGDAQFIDFARQLGYEPAQVGLLQRTLSDNAAVRERALPNVLPTALFVWMALLVGSGRAIASRVAHGFHWPALSRARLADWRLPDGAIWVFLVGLALLVAGWATWAPTAWTLLLNAGLGFCIQGIAVVESLLLARGVPPSIILLSMLFVFTIAMPVFLLTTAALGLSDVWLDYRRLEWSADEDQT
jgi:hypothetical protein